MTTGDLQGHWRRDWIKAPGFEDGTTRVHWMQSGALFVDIRVPQDRPDLSGHTCLADLPTEALDALLQAEGFAGTIVVAQDQCTWRREINWHGVPQAEDIGLMSFDGDTLYEDGVLADYREKWRPEPTAPKRGARIKSGAMAGVLIDTDELFLFGIGPEPTHHVDPSHGDRLAVAAHFASTYCLGRWTGDEGIAVLSTNPFCEGQVVLTRAETWVWHAMSFDGATDPQPLTLH